MSIKLNFINGIIVSHMVGHTGHAHHYLQCYWFCQVHWTEHSHLNANSCRRYWEAVRTDTQIQTHTLTHTHTHSLSHTHTYIHTHTLSLSLSLSLLHTHSHTHFLLCTFINIFLPTYTVRKT